MGRTSSTRTSTASPTTTSPRGRSSACRSRRGAGGRSEEMVTVGKLKIFVKVMRDVPGNGTLALQEAVGRCEMTYPVSWILLRTCAFRTTCGLYINLLLRHINPI